jgi:hypothetical protein
VSRRIHRLLRVPPTGSSASEFKKNMTSCRQEGRMPVLSQFFGGPPPDGADPAGCMLAKHGILPFSLGRLRRLVLTRPSGPGAHHPIACAPGFYAFRCIREGLPMSREPALLTSAGRMPERSQHRVSAGHGWP